MLTYAYSDAAKGVTDPPCQQGEAPPLIGDAAKTAVREDLEVFNTN
jgi:hypothetical protein